MRGRSPEYFDHLGGRAGPWPGVRTGSGSGQEVGVDGALQRGPVDVGSVAFVAGGPGYLVDDVAGVAGAQFLPQATLNEVDQAVSGQPALRRKRRRGLEASPAGAVTVTRAAGPGGQGLVLELLIRVLVVEVIGRGLKVPVKSMSAEEAQAHFGWLAMFASFDLMASSALTQKKLGWHPTGPGLIADLEQMNWGQAVTHY